MARYARMKAALTAFFLLAASIQAAEPQIVITSKIIGIDIGSPVLKEAGLLIDSEATGGISNLGILTPEKTAWLIERLNQTKGINVLSAPSVTTKDTMRATVEVVREFLYPTEFDPPKIDNAPDGKPVTLKPGETITATPATPTAFEMRPLGIRIEFVPTLLGDGSIDLELAPEITTFEGFHSHGSPIKAATADKDGKIHEVVLTENTIQQPEFRSMKTRTTVTLAEGHTLVLGGLAGSGIAAPGKPDPQKKAPVEGHKPAQLMFFLIQARRVAP